MTNSDTAIREIAEKHFPCVGTRNDREYRKMEQDALVSSITSLISEHYYPKEFVEWLGLWAKPAEDYGRNDEGGCYPEWEFDVDDTPVCLTTEQAFKRWKENEQ